MKQEPKSPVRQALGVPWMLGMLVAVGYTLLGWSIATRSWWICGAAMFCTTALSSVHQVVLREVAKAEALRSVAYPRVTITLLSKSS